MQRFEFWKFQSIIICTYGFTEDWAGINIQMYRRSGPLRLPFQTIFLRFAEFYWRKNKLTQTCIYKEDSRLPEALICTSCDDDQSAQSSLVWWRLGIWRILKAMNKCTMIRNLAWCVNSWNCYTLLLSSFLWEVLKDFTVDLYRVNSQECSHGCHMRGCLEGQGFVQKALHHTHAYYWWFIVQKLHLCTGRHPHCPLCYVISSIG
jgi:hypothetical protein